MRLETLFLCAFAAGVALPLLADGEYAVTVAASAPQTFALYTSAAATPTFAVAAGALSSPFDITYREGETVTATSPDGVTAPLSGTGGVIAYTPTCGGLWTFANSNGETACVGVDWSVHGDGFAPVADVESAVVLHTIGDGPDRKLKRRDAPPVAYSGDDWAGDLTKAATLTFTPPDGGEAQTPTLDPAGTGVKSFTFDKVGDWTVALTFADGTTKTATVTIQKTGFMLIVR